MNTNFSDGMMNPSCNYFNAVNHINMIVSCEKKENVHVYFVIKIIFIRGHFAVVLPYKF